MASGTPVVAFANTALPEVIGNGGAFVTDGDVGSMADEVGRIVDDPARARELVERGLTRARVYDWDLVADRYAEVYRELSERP